MAEVTSLAQRNSATYNFNLQTTAAFNPADATTYFVVLTPLASPFGGYQRYYPMKAGRIVRARITIPTIGALATAETSTIYVRVNDTTDYSLSSVVALNGRVYAELVTGLSIPIAAGDYLEIKWVTPTWSTNPTNVVVGVELEMES